MSRVFVIAKHGDPLMPCEPARARQLLKKGMAVVHRTFPFVIRLKQREAGEVQPVKLKLDPGSRTTGIALTREAPGKSVALKLIELEHRGRQISEALTARRSLRRRRRGQLRYRSPRFLNRGNMKKGWLAPSLVHRVHSTMSWVERMRRWVPVSDIASELVRFDTQALENPEVTGVEYQQGTLAGYEVREYLLEKWARKCAYCDATGVPLQIEHIVARSRGGTDRISNLALACGCCNQRKGALSIQEFLAKEQARLKNILACAKAPLKDAAAVNSTRWRLANELKATGLPVKLSSGGRTKFNRSQLGVPKSHALDAMCVGEMVAVEKWTQRTIVVKSTGRGAYQRALVDAYGFPKAHKSRQKMHFGFQTGDMVFANVPNGKFAGSHFGRIAVRSGGQHSLKTSERPSFNVNHKHCCVVQRADGYCYSWKPTPMADDKGPQA